MLRFTAYILFARTPLAANRAGGPAVTPDCVKLALGDEQRRPQLAGSQRARRAERVQLVSVGEASQDTCSCYRATCTTASTRCKTHVHHRGAAFLMDGRCRINYRTGLFGSLWKN